MPEKKNKHGFPGASAATAQNFIKVIRGNPLPVGIQTLFILS
ncbi:MAG: hypothetical protein JWN60_1790 [Acidobacteria bacterium]|jgi:hypothetical protein|nr:hypothetical protein [Acidobacteriota bacterium]